MTSKKDMKDTIGFLESRVDGLVQWMTEQEDLLAERDQHIAEAQEMEMDLRTELDESREQFRDLVYGIQYCRHCGGLEDCPEVSAGLLREHLPDLDHHQPSHRERAEWGL